MIKQINKLPLGLLDAFGVKSMGSYPKDVNNEIHATFDLTDFQLSQQETAHRLFSSFTSGTVSGFGGLLQLGVVGNPLFIVPTGNLFLLRSYHAYFVYNNPVGGAITLYTPILSIQSQAGSFQRALPIYQGMQTFTLPAAAAVYRVPTGSFQDNIVMGPGTVVVAEFGLPSTVIAAGNDVTFILEMTGVQLAA